MFKEFSARRESITVADCRKPDMPLMYVNYGFELFSGYSREEVVGRNCRFLQGPETDPSSVYTMRTAILAGESCIVDLVNYRKDGKAFSNRLSLRPVHDAAGTLAFYIGLQVDMTELHSAERDLIAFLRRQYL